MLSAVLRAGRFDPEYFRTEDLADEKALLTRGSVRIGTIAKVFTGKTPEYDEEGGVPVVRAGDLVSALVYPGCSDGFLNTRRRKGLVALRRDDVLVSSIGLGSIGKISLVVDPGSFVTVSEVTVIRALSYPAVAIFAFLRTPLAQRLLIREATGSTGQQHLLPGKVENLLLPPAPSTRVCEQLSVLVQTARRREMEAKTDYATISALAISSFSLNVVPKEAGKARHGARRPMSPLYPSASAGEESMVAEEGANYKAAGEERKKKPGHPRRPR